MGIERFFSAINKNFNVVSIYDNTIKLSCDVFLIDFNSIIHTISAKLISELNKKTNNKYNKISIDEIEDVIILEVKNYVDNLIKSINCNQVYIAIDGIPTFSKILEQKKRRFIGDFIDNLVKKYSLPFSFNKNLISPGTKFMKKISDYLNKEDFGIKTIISDSDDTGEGEFKILDYVLDRNLKDIIIYSPDADLIILSMIFWANTQGKINILRFDQNTRILNVIYINHLVDYLFDYYQTRIDKSIDKYKYINDLSLIFTLFGNDFLPRLESININMDLYLVLDNYIINYIDNDYIIIDDFEINIKSLFNYLNLLNKYEHLLIRRNANQYKYHNFNYANTVNLYLDLKNKKYNPLFIFYFDFGTSLESNTKYGKLEYYFYTPNELLSKSYTFKNNFNEKYIENNLRYQKFEKTNHLSNTKKHLVAMKDMNQRDKELYLINNRLDSYNLLFSSKNDFYEKTLDPKDYYKSLNVKDMVNQYLRGWKWIINYYFKRDNIDETWFYQYHKSPLLNDIIKYFTPQSLNYNFKNTKLNINTTQLLLFITPIRIKTIDDFLNIIDVNDKMKIKIRNFIESNLNLFYNLDEIYQTVSQNNFKIDLFDCSTATFISKCHYHILDNIIPINNYLKF